MVVVLCWLAACDGADPVDGPHQETEPLPLDAVQMVDRASMALRGIRAPEADLETVRADPSRLEEVVRSYTSDPLFGETLRDMHAEQLHFRWSVLDHGPSVGPLAIYDHQEILDSFDEAGLRLVEDTVLGGRPYTEVVTTPDTMANEIVAAAFGLDFDPAGPEWQRTPWKDGRPAAGLLVDNNLFQRYQVNPTNHHRSRANAVAGTFLCDPIADRQGLDLDVKNPEGLDLVKDDPNCVACHSTLDPLASNWWSVRGFILAKEIREATGKGCPEGSEYACYPLNFWDPSLDEHVELGLPDAAFYGTPVSDLADLGRQIAADPRFATCTATRFYSWLTNIEGDAVPFEVSAELAEEFAQSGFDARELAVRSVLHPTFDSVSTIRPEQYARFVNDITGYVWVGTPDPASCGSDCEGEVDLARNDLHGNHTVMGGSDGWYALTSTLTSMPAAVLAQMWLAEEAAAFVVDHDLDAPEAERRLLLAGDPAATVDEQLAHLRARILGPMAGADPAALRSLYDGALARNGGDVRQAYALVVTALLLDEQAVLY